MSSIFETYLKVREDPFQPGIEEGVFFSTAVEKIAAEKDISVDDVRLIVIAEAAKARAVPMEEMERAVDTLCRRRDSEHAQAEDWKEDLIVEREYIAKERELIRGDASAGGSR